MTTFNSTNSKEDFANELNQRFQELIKNEPILFTSDPVSFKGMNFAARTASVRSLISAGSNLRLFK